jgi:hypothetical protein
MAEEDLTFSDDEPLSLSADQDQPAGGAEAEEEPIRLVDHAESGDTASGVKAFGAAAGRAHRERQFQRPLNKTGTGATRCRVFHSKISEASLEYMQGQINEWLDAGEIEVKQVGHLVGTLEGKTPTPNIFVFVWY